jgi:hypothetical protein
MVVGIGNRGLIRDREATRLGEMLLVPQRIKGSATGTSERPAPANSRRRRSFGAGTANSRRRRRSGGGREK